MDEDARHEARATRGCRCCGWFLLIAVLSLGALLWADYVKTQRLTEEMDLGTLESTAEVEEFLAEQDIKVKHEEGAWKADAPWKQELVDKLRERFDTLASDERVSEAQQRADESAQYLRSLLEDTPEEILPHLDEFKERLAYVTDRETVREAINELSQLDYEWLEQEAQRLLDSKPGENVELYIEKLRAMFDNVQDEGLREKLREGIEDQLGVQQKQAELGELPEINPETGELPLVLEYMKQQAEQREPVDWSFVKEVELDDGHAYSVVVSFSDGSETTYYIRGGSVVFVATLDAAAK